MSNATTHRGIVVGVDGSPPSKVAVDWPAREAAMCNVSLTLVHIIPRVRMWPEVATPREIVRWYEKQGRGFLSDARKTRGATNGSDAIQLDIEMSTGGVLSTLIDMSKEADMVGRLSRTWCDWPTTAGVDQLGTCPPCILSGRGRPRQGPVDALTHREGVRCCRDRWITGVGVRHCDRLR
jgi:hypothetical protein